MAASSPALRLHMPSAGAHVPIDRAFGYLLIVRRDCEDKLAVLRQTFANQPSVRVLADRRVRDRRAQAMPVSVDRRQRRDRRGAPPPSWDVADYILVAERVPRASA